jgi:hypothetical protein
MQPLLGNAFKNGHVPIETTGAMTEELFSVGPCHGVINGTSLEVNQL